MCDAGDQYAAIVFEQRAKRHGVGAKRIVLPTIPSTQQTVRLFENAMTQKSQLLVASHMVDGLGDVLPIRDLV